MKQNFLLGVISGMGPRVTLPFCNQLINNNVNKDQDHIPYILFSDPTIQDRTTSILTNNTNEVLDQLNNIIKKLEKCNVTHAIILCNTAHFWLPKLKHEKIIFYNILTLTKDYILENKLKKTLLLATEGTYKTKIYERYFNNEYILQYPNENQKKLIMKIIYDCKIGNNNINELIELIKTLDTDNIILGCTELSILLEGIRKIDNINIIDPIFISTDHIINYFNSN